MKKAILVAGVIFMALAIAGTCGADKRPRVFILNPKLMLEAKQRIHAGDKHLLPALEALRKQADGALSLGPYSVMEKQTPSPTGDKHDYYSLAIYWWPNPDTANHEPYLRRDGQVNPQIQEYDGGRIAAMASTVYTLALAYYYTQDERYSERCTLLLRTWFLNPSSRMNPHLRFAQHIPGVIAEGNCSGLIDTVVLSTNVVDAIGLIGASKSWTKSDQKGMEKWFSSYLNWLLESKPGKEEAAQPNNHGAWYDAQIMAYALLTGREKLAARICRRQSTRRIAVQIMPDGSQLAELMRTKAFDYSLYSLEAMFNIASMAERVNVNLWQFKGDKGQGIRTALDYLTPYADSTRKWPYPQITGFHPENLFSFLRRAAIAYKEPTYEAIINNLPGTPEERQANRINLLYPNPKAPSLSK